MSGAWHRGWWAAVLLVACGGGPDPDAGPRDAEVSDTGAVRPDGSPGDAGPDIEAMGPLPAPARAQTEHFLTHDRCTECHAAEPGVDALRDESGRDVSMGALWPTSMMSFAARDPVYLAAFAHELEANPAARDTVDATCSRCHAAGASVEEGLAGGHPSFEALTTSPAPSAVIGRDGVTCTVCHQIRDEGLGTETSFTGGFVIGTEREIFGPHSAVFAMPMRMATGFTPVTSAHVRDSGLCATCHTVITRALDDTGASVGPPFPEQVPYLEWRNSDFAEGRASEASCQSCHVPTDDVDGVPIHTRIATRPTFVDERSPVGRHSFRGANAYVLRLIAANADWVGTNVPAASLEAAALDSEANLRRAVSLTFESLTVDDTELRATVRVQNLSGHRFPTGYPTRRAWLRVTGLDEAGVARWVSGRVDARGALIDAAGERLDAPDQALPHRQVIDAEHVVQVWHTEMVDASDARTHTLLRAVRYRLDDRILPRGWSASHPDAALTSPVGAEADPDFVPGSDDVQIRVPRSSGAVRLRVELLFQTVTPTQLDALADRPTPAGVALAGMVARTPATPIVVHRVEGAP